VTQHPAIPPRWQVGTPVAMAIEPGTVWLRHDLKAAEDGNGYRIDFFAMTNVAGIAEGDPSIDDLATNRWPFVRCHIDLSLDDGQTWTRRIAYGAKVDADRIGGHVVWSPPEDYSLLTTNARLRAVPLDGVEWPVRTPPAPYDLPSGTHLTSARFAIVGATIDAPAAGILWRGSGVTLQWRQSGGGPVWDLYWITPGDIGTGLDHWVTSISNVVHGANTKVVSLNVPDAEQLRLVLISRAEPSIVGYSPVYTVDP
jgi:hypothetical protein